MLAATSSPQVSMDWSRFLVSDYPVPHVYTVPACKLDSSVMIRARTSRAAYSLVMTTVLRRRHLILVMDSRISQQGSITCTIVTHS